MARVLPAWRCLAASLAAVISVSTAHAQQSQYSGPIFYTTLTPQTGDPSGGIKVICAGVWVDLNCDNVVTLQDALLYADLCTVAGEGESEGLLSSADTLQMRCRKAVAVAEAFAAIHNRPDLFTDEDGMTWLADNDCPPTVTIPTQGGSSQIQCSGMGSIAAAVVQHVAGVLPNFPETTVTPPALPTNRPSGNPNIYVPPPAEPPEPTTPNLPRVNPGDEFTPSPTPCTVPTPDHRTMPGGDGPIYCSGEIDATGESPCKVSTPPAQPGAPDPVYCLSAAGACEPPVVDPNRNSPHDASVPSPDTCAGSNPCVPTCDDIPCSEGRFPDVGIPKNMCGGVCDAPDVELGPGRFQIDDSALKFPGGIYRAPIDLTPPEKEPVYYCGADESKAPASTSGGGNGSGESPKSCQPVDLVSGHKMEQETDLTVALTGRDFHLVRHYSSNPYDTGHVPSGGGYVEAPGWGLFGHGWSSPLFQQLLLTSETQPTLVLMGRRQNGMMRFCQDGQIWRPCGPAQDTIASQTALDLYNNTVDVYRVKSPGEGETLFYRTGELAGKLLRERDEFGNSFWFEYRWFGTVQSAVPRLHRVYLNGTSVENAQAVIEFGYNLVEDGLAAQPALQGRVGRVLCYRFTGSGSQREAIETHRLEYTYKHPADGFSTDCGTDGDLLQVVKYSRVDLGAPRQLWTGTGARTYGPGYEHQVAVTQYRYHNGSSSETGEERVDVVGPRHCLKSVFRPVQLEAYAELLNRDIAWLSGSAVGLRDAAYRLMILADDSMAVTRGSEQYRVFELAEKIVGYAGQVPGAGSKVVKQYLQTGGCGCGGTTQAVRQDFARFDWSTGARAGRSTAITDYYRSTGSSPAWVPYRRRYVDSQRQGSSSAFYGIHSVLDELNSSGAMTRRWISKFVYNATTRALEEQWTPSACAGMTYTPAVEAGSTDTAPSLSGSGSSNGLINYYLYNADSRLIEAGVRRPADSTGTPVIKIEYGASDSGSERKHLPKKIERIADPSASAGAGTETTWFEYTFYSGGSYPNAIQSIRTIVEAELPEENGPAGSGVTYSTLTLLDEFGRAVWTAAADGVLTRRSYDDRTGRVTQLVANADPGDLGSFAGLYSDWASDYALSTTYTGTELVYGFSRDEQGRLIQSESPGPDGTITRQWMYGYRRIDEPGLNEKSGVPFSTFIMLPHKWGSGSTAGAEGPISMVWANAGGGTVHVSGFETEPESPLTRSAIASLQLATVSSSNGLPAYLGDESKRRILRFSIGNQLLSFTAWHDVDGSWGRPEGDRSYTVSHEYDQLGRQHKTISETGDVTQVTYDALGRILTEHRGVEGAMTLVASYFYDSGGGTTQGVGNGNLTVTQVYSGEGSQDGLRTHKYTYDFRDRLVSIENPLPPHQFFVYDNLGRITESADFSDAVPTAIDSADRGSYARQYYSQRGLPYRSIGAINPADLDDGFVESHRWFDGVGRTIATLGPDSPGVKLRYDRLGRVTLGFVTDRGGDDAPGSGSYADAATLAGDTVLEQTEYTYTSANLLSLVRHLVRPHDAATGQGRLVHPDDPALGESTGPGIASYTGYRYDSAARLVRAVEFGTNKAPDDSDRLGDAFMNATAPSWSSTGALPNHDTSGFENALVTAVSYNARGLVDSVADPKGRVGRTLYDDLNRVIANIENVVGSGIGVEWDAQIGRWAAMGIGASDPTDQNRITSYAHVKITQGEEQTWRLRQTAHFPPRTMGQDQVDAQVTEIVYGVSSATSAGGVASLIAMSLPREVRFPDEATGEPGTSDQYKVRYAYNRLGELRSAADQNGTAHQYIRDAYGRVINDLATFPQGSAVDQTITAIGVEFDGMGRVSDVRSFESPTEVRDHVRYGYNAIGLLTDLTQDHDSDIDSNGSTEPSRLVQYGYQIANMAGGNHVRATAMHYPTLVGPNATTTTTLALGYGVDAQDPQQALNDHIGRVNALVLQDVITVQGQGEAQMPQTLAEYSYVGLGAASHADLADLGVQLDRTLDATGRRNYGINPTQTVGAYPSWDRFGRVKRNTWVSTAYDTVQDTGGIWAPNRREYSSLSYLYDQVGNPIAKKNEQLDAGFDAGYGDRWPDRDWKYSYDGLDRLVQAQRGELGGTMSGTLADTTFARAAGSQKWALDALGNWDQFAIDFNNNNPGNADPTFDSPSEFQDRAQAGGHNMANELASLPGIPAAPTSPLISPYSVASSGFEYDHNGNRTASGWDYPSGVTPAPAVEGLRFKYTYDAWNRLVKIERAPFTTGGGVGTYSTIAEYTYNGLNWRTTKHTVGGVGGAGNQILADDATPVLREKRWFWYDAAWRAIAEDVDDDTTNGAVIAGLVNVSGIDRRVQQFFGLRGINDAVYRREDRATKDPSTQALIAPDGRFDTAWGTAANQTVDTYVYQLSDPQGSVVAALFDGSVNPRLVDEVEYDPYGRARRTSQGDFNHTGSISTQDNFDFLEAYFLGAPAGDANDSGATGIQDIYDFLGEYLGGETTPTDRISGWSVYGIIDNPYGYCGYYYDGETAAAKVLGPNGGGLYHVRHRVYDPIAGRWLTRDPAGFVDGMNLYEYCSGMSTSCWDPLGLYAEPHDGADGLREYCDAWSGKRDKEDTVHKKAVEDARRNQVDDIRALVDSGKISKEEGRKQIDAINKWAADATNKLDSMRMVQRLQEAFVDWAFGSIAIDLVGAAASSATSSPSGSSSSSGSGNSQAGSPPSQAGGTTPAGGSPESQPSPDFIADENGTVIPTDRQQLENGLKNFPNEPTESPGRVYELPDGDRVRVMERNKQNPLRAVFENENGQPINPFTGKPPQPPYGHPNPKDYVRSRTHLPLKEP